MLKDLYNYVFKKSKKGPTVRSLKYLGENLPEENKKLLRKEFEEGIIKVSSYPEELTLATTTKCNSNPPCVICERNLRNTKIESDCSDEVIEKLKIIFPYLDIIYLHCGGEPLIYSKFSELINIIKPPTKVRFNTNGVLLNKEKIDFIMKSKVVDVINFSIDAATEETHRKIRSNKFDVVINNISSLVLSKKEMKSEIPIVIFNMCIMGENFLEIPKFIQLAKDIGANGVDFFHLNNGPNFNWSLKRGDFYFDYKEQQKFDLEEYNKKITEAYWLSKKLGIGVNFAGDVFHTEDLTKEQIMVKKEISELNKWENKKCIAPWSRVVVGEKGTVKMCYFHEEYESIGNLNKNSFDEIWNGKKAQLIRKQALEGGFADVCQKENKCIFRGRV